MKQLTLLLYLCIGAQAIAQNNIGVNLAAYNDFSPEFLFKDVFKSSREWISFDPANSGVWDTGLDIPLREDGYPLEIPFNDGVHPQQAVRTLVLWGLPHGHPSGGYTYISQGSGTVRIRQQGGAQVTFASPATQSFDSNGTGGIMIEILNSSAADPVRNIRFVMPGFLDSYETAPFHPELLAFLENFRCIRYMDLMHTNDSPIVEWGDRTAPDYYSQAQASGVAYEYLVQLSNTLNKDLWVNIPHQADDDFIEQFASFLQTNLNPGLTIYLEYSNELWNGIFGQNNYAAAQGLALGYDGEPWERGWKFTAKRSADVFTIFEDVFDDDSRLVKVIPSQASNPFVAGYILDRFGEPLYNPTGIEADALAIAPYFGGTVANDIGTTGLINTITIDEILDRVELSLPTAYDNITAHRTLAEERELALLAYEGGQHLVDFGMFNNNATLTAKLNEANRQQRMGDLYCQYIEFWFEQMGSLFMHYNSHSKYDRNGSWGLKEYMGQPDAESPKLNAILDCSTVGTETAYKEAGMISLAPNPASQIARIIKPENILIENIYVSNALGKAIVSFPGDVEEISIGQLPAGLYFVSFMQKGKLVACQKLIKF